MKRTLFLFILSLMLISAQAESRLLIEPLSGSERVLALSQIGRIVAQRDFVFFYAKDNSVLAKLPTSEIRRISFNTPTEDVQLTATTMRVYPNPTQDALIVSGAEGTRLRVYNLNGELLIEQPVSGDETTVNVTSLPAGTYLLLTGNQVTKFIKQ